DRRWLEAFVHLRSQPRLGDLLQGWNLSRRAVAPPSKLTHAYSERVVRLLPRVVRLPSPPPGVFAEVDDPSTPPLFDAGHTYLLFFGLCAANTNRISRPTGALMFRSSRSQRATVFVATPSASASWRCVQLSFRRIDWSSAPRIAVYQWYSSPSCAVQSKAPYCPGLPSSAPDRRVGSGCNDRASRREAGQCGRVRIP